MRDQQEKRSQEEKVVSVETSPDQEVKKGKENFYLLICFKERGKETSG